MTGAPTGRTTSSRRRRVGRWLAGLLIFGGLLVALYAQRGPLLGAWGAWWVVNEPLEKSQAIVVLGGDSPAGDRVRHAVELYRQEWAPQIVCSGTLLRYDFSESALMESEARRMGVPGDALLVVPASSESTLEEALVLRRFLTEHKLNRIIVVTSDFHTRRSRTIFRKVLGQAGFDVRLSACSDARYSPRTWWQQREGKKQMVLEILKSVATWWELRQVPRNGAS